MERYEIVDDCFTPKYEQIIRIILSDIESGIYKKGERVPSINEFSQDYLIARGTVEKAYHKLQEKGILLPVKGKGYFVAHTDFTNRSRVALLFNKLSNYKKEIYDGFVKTLDKKAMVDLHIYNYNIKLFEQIIKNNIDEYDYFVIMPHFYHGAKGLVDIVRAIPREKVIIIDKKINDLINDYPTVYQDFENDIYEALKTGLPLLKKYQAMELIFPSSRHFSKEILAGFTLFCKAQRFDFNIIDRIEDEEIHPGHAYVVISDDDLVQLIKKAQGKNLKIGKDLGIVSYNENLVKEILAGGITTISTNHVELGARAAQMILERKKDRIKIPFVFINRNSL
jgi:DNA-binding transcriptional regulator YhcF (GntR family)